MAKKAHDGPYDAGTTGPSGTHRIDVAARRAHSPFPLTDLDAAELLHWVTRVLSHRDMLSLTLTSDGGAMSITITCDGQRYRAFAKDGSEFLTATADLCATVYGD